MAYALTVFEMDFVGMDDAGQVEAMVLAARLPITLGLRAHLRQLGWPTWNMPRAALGLPQLLEVYDALAPDDPLVEAACQLLAQVPHTREDFHEFAVRAYRFARNASVQSWEDFFDDNGIFTYFDQCALATALVRADQQDVGAAPVDSDPGAPIEIDRLRRLWQREFQVNAEVSAAAEAADPLPVTVACSEDWPHAAATVTVPSDDTR